MSYFTRINTRTSTQNTGTHNTGIQKAVRTTLSMLLISSLMVACNTPTKPNEPHTSTPNIPATPVTSAPSTSTPAVSSLAEISQIGDQKYYTRHLVVKYRDESSLQTAAQAVSGQVLDRIPEIRTALIKVSGDALKAVHKARSVAGVLAAAPDYIVGHREPISKPSQPFGADSALSQQNTQFAKQIFDELPQYALDRNHLNAEAAWKAGLTGKGVTIAILDDPVDVTHPDLKANWAGLAYDPGNNKVYTDAENWVKDIKSRYVEHGTMVASSAVSPKDGKGIVGTAPDAKFISVMFNPAKTKPNEFYGGFFQAKGAVWAVNQGAKILNNSWGGSKSWGALKDAFDYALSQGVVVTAALGNSAQDELSHPTGLPGVIGVGALDGSNNKTAFSTSGRHTSVAAPGETVLVALPTWYWEKSKPADQKRFVWVNGTSFSTPYASGVAALVLQKCPQITPYQVRRVMEMYADSSIGSNPNGWDRDTGWGRLDAGQIAKNLNCSKLPAKGAYVKVDVKYTTPKGVQEGNMADLILRSKKAKAGTRNDPAPIYLSATNEEGIAMFAEIEPGEYDLYVAGPDPISTGFAPRDRGSYLGSVTATSGSTYTQPDLQKITLKTGFLDYNPVDPYEPNDSIETATKIAYGFKSKMAYIHGKPQDADYFRFEGKKGDKIKADVLASGRLGSTMDAYLFLLDSKGKKLAENDDRGEPRIDQDSTIEHVLPADGVYYLHVSTCPISCKADKPEDDDSPFNRYQLELKKMSK